MKININDLQKLTTLLLSKLTERFGNEIEIKNDFYWDIFSDELYNPYIEPKNISLGQLSDDITEISRPQIMENAIAYDLKRISNILKALSIEHDTAF